MPKRTGEIMPAVLPLLLHWPGSDRVALGMAAGLLGVLAFAGAGYYRTWRRNQQVLRLAEERARLIVESVKDYAIIMLDCAGCVIGWNIGAERIKGYSSREIEGRHFSAFYPEESVQSGAPARALAIAAESGRFEDVGWRLRKDGERFWANVVITALRRPDGTLVGFAKITRDLTERKKAEVEIEGLYRDLRRRAEQLEAANRELEAFSYSVSHDLRAPLRHIAGFSAILEKEGAGLTDDGRRLLSVISDAARQMGRLIDDLLAFSRFGRVPLRRVEVDQDAMVAAVVGEAGAARAVEWRVSPLPSVRADPALLRLVWVNLVGNAVKYSSKSDRPVIDIGSARDPSTGCVEFHVKDNGVGFDMRHASKLFGIFQRLHGAAEFEGNGIGLANVQRIVARHGGRVRAEGVVGAGASFYFTIPDEPSPDGAQAT